MPFGGFPGDVVIGVSAPEESLYGEGSQGVSPPVCGSVQVFLFVRASEKQDFLQGESGRADLPARGGQAKGAFFRPPTPPRGPPDGQRPILRRPLFAGPYGPSGFGGRRRAQEREAGTRPALFPSLEVLSRSGVAQCPSSA